MTSQPHKAGQVVDLKADLWGRGKYSKLNCSTLLREELTKVAAEGQCSCCLVKTPTVLTTLHALADLPHLPMATNLVNRRNHIILTRQSPSETPSNSCLYANTRIGYLRNNFYQRAELLVVLVPRVFCCGLWG
jgi:hypothetical protein